MHAAAPRTFLHLAKPEEVFLFFSLGSHFRRAFTRQAAVRVACEKAAALDGGRPLRCPLLGQRGVALRDGPDRGDYAADSAISTARSFGPAQTSRRGLPYPAGGRHAHTNCNVA